MGVDGFGVVAAAVFGVVVGPGGWCAVGGDVGSGEVLVGWEAVARRRGPRCRPILAVLTVRGGVFGCGARLGFPALPAA